MLIIDALGLRANTYGYLKGSVRAPDALGGEFSVLLLSLFILLIVSLSNRAGVLVGPVVPPRLTSEALATISFSKITANINIPTIATKNIVRLNRFKISTTGFNDARLGSFFIVWILRLLGCEL